MTTRAQDEVRIGNYLSGRLTIGERQAMLGVRSPTGVSNETCDSHRYP